MPVPPTPSVACISNSVMVKFIFHVTIGALTVMDAVQRDGLVDLIAHPCLGRCKTPSFLKRFLGGAVCSLQQQFCMLLVIGGSGRVVLVDNVVHIRYACVSGEMKNASALLAIDG